MNRINITPIINKTHEALNAFIALDEEIKKVTQDRKNGIGISVQQIAEACLFIEQKLSLPKEFMNGTIVQADVNNFLCFCYSLQFIAEYGENGWEIIDLFIGISTPGYRFCITHTSKSADYMKSMGLPIVYLIE